MEVSHVLASKQNRVVPRPIPIGGSWKKSPHSTSCMPPKGWGFPLTLEARIRETGECQIQQTKSGGAGS